MNKKLSACLFVIVTLSYCFIPAVGAATVLDFEGITPVITNPGFGTIVEIPNGYGGLNWSGTTSPPIASEGHSAFSDGAVSPIYAAVFGTQTVTVTNPNGTFDFLSVWVTGGWADKTATVFGYLDDVEIYSKTDMVATNGVQTQYTLNWTGIDKLVFPIVEDGNNDDYVLDNFTIDNVTVPEPSTFALGITSLIALSCCTRRRRKQKVRVAQRACIVSRLNQIGKKLPRLKSRLARGWVELLPSVQVSSSPDLFSRTSTSTFGKRISIVTVLPSVLPWWLPTQAIRAGCGNLLISTGSAHRGKSSA